MNFILTLLGTMFVLDMVYWLTGETWARRYGLNVTRWVHRGFIWFQLLLLITFIVTRFGSVHPGAGRSTAFAAFMYIWHMVVLPLCLVAVPAALVAVIVALVRWIRGRSSIQAEPAPSSGFSRREFLAAAALSAPPLITLGLTGLALRQIQTFRVRQIQIPVPNLPKPLHGLTIAHLSDFHVGKFTHGPVLRKIVEQTNALRADLIVMTGDLIDRALSDLPAAIDVLRALDPRDGLCVIEGNHDLFEGRGPFEAACRSSGVPFLSNEALMLNVRGLPLQLLGLRWGAGGKFPHTPSERGDGAIEQSMEDLLKERVPDAFPILLAHHPHAFDSAVRAGIPLTLSGHTHGGQLMWNDQMGFGPAMYRYWSGLYRKESSSLVVSNGIGNWFPLRINAPAEIILIELLGA